ncbi:MAG TPA: YihY/virulence factor BrkB family protein [Candidatus Saccharimonadales bacterium]|jgi:membrane protein|nr:YihY/virulence factor BrkB family protein [Candidatus Saccharimonadales bacterium]
MTIQHRNPRHEFNLIWNLGGLTPWGLTKRVLRDALEDDLTQRASSLAFDLLLAFFPLLVFLLAIFGLFASRSVELRIDLLSYFADFLPPEAFQLLSHTIDELAENASKGNLTISILGVLWFASGGISSMISGLHWAYRVKDNRSWIKVRVVAIGMTLFIAVLIFSALSLVLVGGFLINWAAGTLHLNSVMIAIWKVLQWPIAWLFVVCSYALIYSYGPNAERRHWYWITPGSTFGALLWLASSVGFRVYLNFSNRYTAIYGSLGAVVILTVWLYVTGLTFLVGGEIDANIERASDETQKKLNLGILKENK